MTGIPVWNSLGAMTATRTTWGQRIRARREGRGLTQTQLAEAVGVGQSAVAKWERDLTAPSVRLLPLIAAALAADAADLFTHEGEC